MSSQQPPSHPSYSNTRPKAGPSPLDDDRSRTTSPTVLLHYNHPESDYFVGTSPVPTSQSTLSTSSPVPSQYHHHLQHQQNNDPSYPAGQSSSYLYNRTQSLSRSQQELATLGQPPSLAGNHIMSSGTALSPVPQSSRNHPGSSSAAPLPVRSASWAAPETTIAVTGSHESLSIPSMITTSPAEAAAAATGGYASASPTLTSTAANASSSSSLKSHGKKKQLGKAKKGEKQPAATVAPAAGGDSVTARRQKRLERNRESARLSRRRRKQYLEVLEEKVSQLSLDTDRGRREHAAAAIPTVLSKRRSLLSEQQQQQQQSQQKYPMALHLLDGPLSRTSRELSVLSTFQMQQLKSFALPAHSKFVLWLTLQGDLYFRGGRAASERLSAARIGERMLQGGNDKVPPINSMWPLFCNEVGLSYDQEERVRTAQRGLLQDSATWLERHTARASSLAMKSFHDGVNAMGVRIEHRERGMQSKLTPDQRMRLAVWAEQNGNRIRQRLQGRRDAKQREEEQQKLASGHQLLPSQHIAANIYILNNRLQNLLGQGPRQVELVAPAQMRKLSRRPSFESLGQQKDDNGNPLARENSFASSGSLKQSVSSLSIVSENGEERAAQQIRPEDAEAAAVPAVDKELGFVKELIPPIVQPTPPAAPAPVPLPPAPSAASYHRTPATLTVPASATPPYALARPGIPPQHQQHPMAPHPVLSQPPHGHPIHAQASVGPGPLGPPPAAPMHVSYQYYTTPPPAGAPLSATTAASPPQQPLYAPPAPGGPLPPPPSAQQPIPPMVYSGDPVGAPPQLPTAPPPHGAQHVRKSSFLPPHLNVVPEEMFPTTDASAEDFLMSLIDDGDWAIGEGIDMDMT